MKNNIEVEIRELLPRSKEEYLNIVKKIIKVQEKSQKETYPNKEYNITEEDIVEEYKSIGPEIWLSSYDKWGKESLGLLVFDKKGNLIAFSTASKVTFSYTDPRDKTKEIEKTKVWIGNIFVLRSYQGMGIGSRLMARIIDFADGLPLALNVIKYNKKAILFYEKFKMRYSYDAKPIVYGRKSLPQICMETYDT